MERTSLEVVSVYELMVLPVLSDLFGRKGVWRFTRFIIWVEDFIGFI